MLRGLHTRIGFDGGRFDVSFVSPKNHILKVEVKWDKKAAESGRVFFEFLNTRQKKPSGVACTDADWWCQVLGTGERALLMPVPWLRDFLQSSNFKQVNTRGADSNSKGYVVPLPNLLKEKEARRINLPTLDDYFGLLVKQSLTP